MPTYEYECDKCGHEFERFQSMSEEPIKTCPECKSKKARRLIGTGAGIIFKGSGFYETDYKRKESGNGKPDAKPESGGETKSESNKESKPDSKTESKTESGSKKPAKKEAAA